VGTFAFLSLRREIGQPVVPAAAGT
jgi:hypothetical protein